MFVLKAGEEIRRKEERREGTALSSALLTSVTCRKKERKSPKGPANRHPFVSCWPELGPTATFTS